jgi:hypothetical protein
MTRTRAQRQSTRDVLISGIMTRRVTSSITSKGWGLSFSRQNDKSVAYNCEGSEQSAPSQLCFRIHLTHRRMCDTL